MSYEQLCPKCDHFDHEIDCPDFVSIDLEIEHILRNVKTDNRFKRDDFKITFNAKKDITVWGDGKTFLHGFCSKHWDALLVNETKFHYVIFKNVLEDDDDKSEWGDVHCRKWFKDRISYRFAVFTPQAMRLIGISMY